MAYPNIEDYVRAVQQPGEVFQIGPLRRAAFELHPVFRIPMPASGSAAVVFKASVDGVDTALRFFIQDDVSSRERYTALARHFAGHGLADCVASAAWVDHAIAIHGATWPVVQMEWIEGRSLDAYVAHLARRNDVGALACLAHIWRGFIARLQDAEFAHGDLQHGNVIVDRNGSLRLVDFDGSWIAAFRGEHLPVRRAISTTSAPAAPGGAGWTRSPGWSSIPPCSAYPAVRTRGRHCTTVRTCCSPTTISPRRSGHRRGSCCPRFVTTRSCTP